MNIVINAAEKLAGQLSVTIQGTDLDLIEYQELLNIPEQKADRVIINGFSIGVEVSSDTVHGGQFPFNIDN